MIINVDFHYFLFIDVQSNKFSNKQIRYTHNVDLMKIL